jgi:hypothetical protein
MVELGFFDSVNTYEPKCEGCGEIIKIGESTEYCEKLETQVCKTCKTPV